MSCQAKSERAKRLERWAETAMAMILRQYKGADPTGVAKMAWDLAVLMEDKRTKVLGALAGLDPQDPNEPPEKPSWEKP